MFFVHVIIDWSFKFPDKEMSQKCDIFIVGFVFIYSWLIV